MNFTDDLRDTEVFKEDYGYREILKGMVVGQNTIAKHRENNLKELSVFGIRQSN